jgi:hypothetical protein
MWYQDIYGTVAGILGFWLLGILAVFSHPALSKASSATHIPSETPIGAGS